MRQLVNEKHGDDLKWKKKLYEAQAKGNFDPVVKKEKDEPLLRGKIHLLLIYTAPIWVFGLLRRCNTPQAFWTSLIAITSALMNFFSSAVLHNFEWTTEAKKSLWCRLDYLCIFLMLSGSCSPIPLLLFERLSRNLWVSMQIIFVTFGAILCSKGTTFNSISGRTLRARAYVVIGLSNALYLPVFYNVLSLQEFTLGLFMAALYIVGAFTYSRRKPDPWPNVFGYHEVFHLCCLISAAFTYILLASVLSRT